MINKKDNQIYLFCDGGLSNRLNSMITGKIMVNSISEEIKPILIWPINNFCMAGAAEILDKKWLEKNFERIEENMDSKLPLISHDKKDRDVFFKSIYMWPFLKKNFLKKYKTFTLETDLPPWWINLANYRKEFRKMIFSEEVIFFAKNIKKDIKNFNFSLHIRSGDWVYGKTKVLMSGLKKLNKFTNNATNSSKIFVSSDSKLITSLLTELFPNNVITSNDLVKSYPSHLSIETVFRDARSVIEAAAEQLVLSQGRLFATSRSSFLFTGYLLSKKSPPTFYDLISFKILIRLRYNLIQFKRIFKTLISK